MSGTMVRRFGAVAVLLMVAAASLGAQAGAAALAGRWDAVVNANKVDVPFVFEVVSDASGLRGSFFNGDVRVTSTAATLENGVATFTFAQYGSTLQATVANGQLSGEYKRARGAP